MICYMAIYTVEGPPKGYPGKTEYKLGEIRLARVYTETFPKGTSLNEYSPRSVTPKGGQLEQGYTVLGILGFMREQAWYLFAGDLTDTMQRVRDASAHAATRMTVPTDYFMMNSSRIFLPADLIERRGGIKVVLDAQGEDYTCRIKYRD